MRLGTDCRAAQRGIGFWWDFVLAKEGKVSSQKLLCSGSGSAVRPTAPDRQSSGDEGEGISALLCIGVST